MANTSGVKKDGSAQQVKSASSSSKTEPKQPLEKPGQMSEATAAGEVDRFEKTVSLTFDDGPHPVNTPRVLEILKRHDVKATFFVTGACAEKYPELIKRIVAEGHDLGNHTYTHADLSKLSVAQAKVELERTQAAIDRALGHHHEISMMRPPYGAGCKTAKEAVAPGQHIVLWNVDSSDWRYLDNDAQIMSNVFEGSESVHARGGVILFHDIHPQTVRILDEVISKLQQAGFDIQRTDATLGQKNPVII